MQRPRELARLDLAVVGGHAVTPSGVVRTGIGVKDGRIAVLAPDELLPRWRRTLTTLLRMLGRYCALSFAAWAGSIPAQHTASASVTMATHWPAATRRTARPMCFTVKS